MASYSVAQAKNELPQLINRALEGEQVVITRRGQVVAELVAKATLRREDGDEAFARMCALSKRLGPSGFTSVQLLNDMYEEDD